MSSGFSHIVVFGAGALGSVVAEALLVRGKVLDVVEPSSTQRQALHTRWQQKFPKAPVVLHASHDTVPRP